MTVKAARLNRDRRAIHNRHCESAATAVVVVQVVRLIVARQPRSQVLARLCIRCVGDAAADAEYGFDASDCDGVDSAETDVGGRDATFRFDYLVDAANRTQVLIDGSTFTYSHATIVGDGCQPLRDAFIPMTAGHTWGTGVSFS